MTAGDIVKRLLDGRFSVWKRKKERRLHKRSQAREKRVREWVSTEILYISLIYMSFEYRRQTNREERKS